MEKVNCPLCQADDAPELMSVYDLYNANGGPFTFVRCRHCGLTYLNPRPSASELLKYNSTMWEIWSVTQQTKEINGSPEYALHIYREIFDVINRQKPDKGKLLEVGSGLGGFLKVCQAQGWDVYGLEISEECVAYIKEKQGIENAFVTDLLDAGFDDNQFDVVIFNHLIEHLPDPHIYLKEIYRILKPDGLLCISTPNIDSVSAKIFGKYWRALFVPLHLVLFSPVTLTKLLQRTNFSITEVSHFSNYNNSFIWLRSLSGFFRRAQHLKKHFSLTNPQIDYSKSSKDGSNSRMRDLYRLLRPALYILISPIIYFESVLKQGTNITIYTKPNK